jgi:hypothetical protein
VYIPGFVEVKVSRAAATTNCILSRKIIGDSASISTPSEKEMNNNENFDSGN